MKNYLLNLLWMTLNSFTLLLLTSLFGGILTAKSSDAQSIDKVFLSLNLVEADLPTAFSKIEEISGFRFSYEFSPKYFNNSKHRLTYEVNEKSLTDILYHIAGQTGLSFKQVNKAIAVKLVDKKKFFIRVENLSLFQEVKGRITISETGEPLPGAGVQLKGTSLGTISDVEGNFSLQIPENIQNPVLIFTYIGFVNREVPVANRSFIEIALSEDLSSLGEVVVVGYGSVKKTDLTGAIATVTSEKISQVNAISNLAQALQGQAAGVQVSQSSGQPGDFMRIKIRGTNSLGGGNDPLYVVDGLPLDGLTAQLNPEDIESISILKDASATAIYGARGANGVIMVTTKSGVSGKAKVTYNSYFGMQNLRRKIPLINAGEFAQLQNEVAQNDGNSLPWTEQQISNLGEGTDWQDLVYGPAPVQNHDLSISGGNERTKYYSSFGYFDQKGIIRNSGFTRLSFRTNMDHDFSEKLNFSTSFSLQNSKYNQAQFKSADGGGGVPFTTMVMPPTQGILNPDGSYTRFTGVPWGETNPVGLSESWNDNSNNLRLIGNAALSYEIVEGLTIRMTAGLDNGFNRADIYFPSNISLGQRSGGDGNPIFGRGSKNYSNSATFINENTLEYRKSFNRHNLIALGGISYQESKSEGLNSGTGIGFLSDIYENHNLSSAITKALPATFYLDNKLLSYYGRFNYDYASKYYLTLTGRYDGSSRFSANNKFAFFPSAAVAWTISEEDFLEDNNTISFLKLRGSFGSSGNQAIGNYQTLANLRSVDVALDNQIYTGFVLSRLENPNLKWETTRQLDIGIDLGLFNEKLLIEADFYNKRTSDLLLNVTLPGSGGFGSVLQNVGEVQNRGFEFQISTQNDFGEFHLSSSLNLTHNRTKVLDLGKDAYDNPITFMEIGAGGNWFPTIVGQSMMQLYGFTVEGIYQTNEEAIANGEPNKRAGDYRFKNWDGQGVVNDTDDRTVLSSLEPNFTFGFNNSMTYRNFDLSLFFIGSYGNDIVNEFRKYNLTMNGNWTPTREFFEQRWQGEGTGNTVDKPSANSASSVRDYANSLWLENGSYLRLRDITLGYSFRPKFPGFEAVSPVRVYISAQNYLTFTNYSGYDPEVSWAAATINGWDRGNYPSAKSITAGLRVNF